MTSDKPSTRDFAMVDGIRVHITALIRLAHACEPTRCERASSCCSSYEVLTDRAERRRITGYLDDAARYAKELAEDGGFVEPFETTEGGKCLATHEDGLCVFAFGNRTARVLCSLHAVAIDRSLPPHRVKPMACAIWPLLYVESDPPLLSVQEDALDFPCNSRRRDGLDTGRLDPGVAELIEELWGSGFRQRIEAILARGDGH